jgi:hypothetical protein
MSFDEIGNDIINAQQTPVNSEPSHQQQQPQINGIDSAAAVAAIVTAGVAIINTNESTPKNSMNENDTNQKTVQPVSLRVPKITDYIQIEYDDLGA